MNSILMIPARLDSKRLPNKNIQPFCGTTLLELAIKKAKASFDNSKIWLNSPNLELEKYAKDNDVNFYLRDLSLSGDKATNADFLKNFILNVGCDVLFMLNTTSPLVTVATIKKFIESYNNAIDTCLSVISEKAPLVIRDEPVNWSYDQHTPSEELLPYKKIVWAISAWRSKEFLSSMCGTYSGKISYYELPKMEAVDVDTKEDWDIARALFNSVRQQMYADINPKSWLENAI